MTAQRCPTLLVVGPVPPPLNGMTVMTSHVLAALRASGWNVVHIDTSDHRPVGNVGRFDLQNVFLAVKHALALLGATAELGKKTLYLPIAQGELGFLRDALFFEVARARQIPVVVHLHGAAFSVFYHKTSRPMQWLIRRCLSRVQQALVLSDSLRSVFGDLIPPAKVRVVPNGIPEVPLAPGDVTIPSGQFTVLFLSNLSPGKGYMDVLGAAKLISAKRDVRFIIAGEWSGGRDQIRSREWIEQHGLGHHVSFVGAPSGIRKAQLFQQADVFVFPPRQIEGQPVVLLEAMSHALPIVATPRGGIVDIIVGGRNGLLVPAGQPSAIAEALLQLMDDKSLRLRMGQEGRRMFLSHHTLDHLAMALDDALVDAMDSGPTVDAA